MSAEERLDRIETTLQATADTLKELAESTAGTLNAVAESHAATQAATVHLAQAESRPQAAIAAMAASIGRYVDAAEARTKRL
jgi:hypothetical protein